MYVYIYIYIYIYIYVHVHCCFVEEGMNEDHDLLQLLHWCLDDLGHPPPPCCHCCHCCCCCGV
jgi:hypothetical protein